MKESLNDGPRPFYNLTMTVRELQEKLNGFDGDTEVVLYREVDHETNFYPLTDVEAHRGKPLRHADGSIGMKFERDGSATWVLLTAGDD